MAEPKSTNSNPEQQTHIKAGGSVGKTVPATDEAVANESTQHTKTLSQKFTEWWKDPYRSRSSWTDRAIVLLTVGIVLLAYMQWKEMHTGGLDTATIADASKKQVCAAQKFASSAASISQGMENAVAKLGQQADDAELFFRTDERAWVEIGTLQIVATFPPESTFGTIFKYGVYPKNNGKTVARNVKIYINNIDNAGGAFGSNKHAIHMYQDQLFHENGSNKRVTWPNKPSPQTLAPGEIPPVPIYSGGQEPRKWGDDYVYTYILGRIDYEDAFYERRCKTRPQCAA